MKRVLVALYGHAVYGLFGVTFLYTIGFISGIGVPKTIDDGPAAPFSQAILIDVALLSLFAIQHTIMARPAFKARITRIIPTACERATFVLMTCLILGAIFWQWRPLDGVVWDVANPALRIGLWAVAALGWAIVLLSTCLIDHFELFGLRQVWAFWRGEPHRPPVFRERLLYRHVRHPLMLGFMIAFWSAPTMTSSHFLFAAVITAYILVAVRIEERDLVRAHGEAYLDYRRRVPGLLPLRFGGKSASAAPTASPRPANRAPAERATVGSR